MREIKFRVWVKSDRRYDFVSIDDLMFEDGNYYLMANRDNFVIMQYTGLKDNNGKDIYDGDIIKLDVGVYKTEVIYEVKWFDKLSWDSGGSLHSGFYLNKSGYVYNDGELELDYHSGFRDCEIIGNIYENHELVIGL